MSQFLVSFIILVLSVSAHSQAADPYQTLTALEKQQIVWQKISSQPYATLPPMTFFSADDWKALHAARIARAASSLGKSFDHVSDEMPEGRVKMIHAYGSAALVEFVADKAHPFTGLFKSGALGLVRLSLGTPMASTGNFVPGMAIKLFVDGVPSKNMHVMQTLEGQGDNRDFFKHTFTNKLPEAASRATKIGAGHFGGFVENPIFLKVDHVASVQANGTREEDVVAPYQLFFRPADVHLPEGAADFRAELAKVPPGSKLYDVFAAYSQYTKTRVFIGTLVTRSNFVSSEYSDKVLYFQHEGAIRRTYWTGRRLR